MGLLETLFSAFPGDFQRSFQAFKAEMKGGYDFFQYTFGKVI